MISSPSLAPTMAIDTNDSEDDDNVNTALAVGLGVPLGILCLFILVYFGWWQNSCGLFKKEDSMKVVLMDNEGGGADEVSKEYTSLNV